MGPATLSKDVDGVPDPWIQSGLALAVVDVSGKAADGRSHFNLLWNK